MNTFNNKQVENLPSHLRHYVVDQHYERYTWIDQAVWRYVMRQNYSYLRHVAYYPYIRGLQQAGLSIERIPDLQNINDHLGGIGWGAVTVDGFIPPSAFMEFQHHRVLVIAADIRQLQHIEYTPAPDIIHESAGHAPIIVEPEYNHYLSYFGSIGSKAMFSAKDFELYEAIRRLSILKEDPRVSGEVIAQAEQRLQDISEDMGEPSEMALLSRLHWWTVEYGLIGTPEAPKIYGAGLLSSIGESNTCMQAAVPKLWYSLDAVNYPYDITRPQPQLFVTPGFSHLLQVLDEFANTMAFRVGGKAGLQKAVDSQHIATAVYSSGLEVSGTFVSYLEREGEVVYMKTHGRSALSFAGKQLVGHSSDYHSDGFSSPVGRLKGEGKALEDFTEQDLALLGIQIGGQSRLVFQSGIVVEGRLVGALFKQGKLLLLTFSDCKVQSWDGTVLFKPEWGIYDMAVGEIITSVYNGAADKSAWGVEAPVSQVRRVEVIHDAETKKLHDIYGEIRAIREGKRSATSLTELWNRLRQDHPDDWLAVLEIGELADRDLKAKVGNYLREMMQDYPQYTKLIDDGLALIDLEVV